MRPLSIAVLVLALAAALLPAASAGAAPPLRGLGPAKVAGVVSDGQRLIAYQHRESSRELTVIDTKTDRRWPVAIPEGCGGVSTASAFRGISERGVILGCSPGDALLDLRTGEHRALPDDVTFFYVGRHWASGDGVCGERTCRAFVNLDTGERRFRPFDAPPIDLDAADFRRLKVCRPFDTGDVHPPGGRGEYAPPFLLGYEGRSLVLRRCGRSRSVRLQGPDGPHPADPLTLLGPALSGGVATWTTATHLRAYDARARRRFAWRIRGARRHGAEALATRWRAVAAVVADVHVDKIEVPATYRLYWARIPR